MKATLTTSEFNEFCRKLKNVNENMEIPEFRVAIL